jgi:hypothetical protein
VRELPGGVGSWSGQDRIELQSRDSAEVANVSGDELKPVMYCSGGNLDVGVGEDLAAFLEMSSQLSKDPCRCHVMGKDGNSRKNEFSMLAR